MRILVTRPRADAEALATALAARGHAAIVEPLIEIEPTDAALSLDGVQGLLATSANGVRALARVTPRRDLPLWAVGEATARAARDAGFAAVEAAGGDVGALAELVARRVDPRAGELVHAAGTHVAGDLAGSLESRGYRVRRAVLYEARAATSLSPALVADLRGAGLDAALFFSPRTASVFVTLLRGAGLGKACARVAGFALSAAVARELEAVPWRSLHVADRPDEGSLLGALDAWARARAEP